jgi:prepilin-type processing-associated H-X9-DG protein
MKRTTLRPAFSVIDLLVALAILGILGGLLFPAVLQVRGVANQRKSANNLKQLALAVHNYESTWGSLPPGVDKKGFSPNVLLLPYLEIGNPGIESSKPPSDEANAKARAVKVSYFLSPDDTLPVTGGATNYLYNAGSQPSLADNNGVFYLNSKIRFADITDGLSNTVMIGETLRGDGKKKAETVARQHVLLGKDDLKEIKDEAGVQDFKDGKNITGDRGANWLDGSFLQGTFTGTRLANDERPDVNCGGAGGLSALRSLGRTVNVAMCDGSVRAVQTTIKLEVWKLVTARNDGKEIPGDF